MYWSVGNDIYMAAMDGSQHHHLVNARNYIAGLTIDAEGQFYHMETSGKYCAMQIYFDDVFSYNTCVMVFCGEGHGGDWEGEKGMREEGEGKARGGRREGRRGEGA